MFERCSRRQMEWFSAVKTFQCGVIRQHVSLYPPADCTSLAKKKPHSRSTEGVTTRNIPIYLRNQFIVLEQRSNLSSFLALLDEISQTYITVVTPLFNRVLNEPEFCVCFVNILIRDRIWWSRSTATTKTEFRSFVISFICSLSSFAFVQISTSEVFICIQALREFSSAENLRQRLFSFSSAAIAVVDESTN